MDFLDSIASDKSIKKAHRVRSWYMYEQFKSLEANQMIAAQKLKDKTYQRKILNQELSERRARRNLCTRTGSARNSCKEFIGSESGIDSLKTGSLCLSRGSEDYLECFCEGREGLSTPTPSCVDDDASATPDDSKNLQNHYFDSLKEESTSASRNELDVSSNLDTDGACILELKSACNTELDTSCNLADDMKEKLEQVRMDIAEGAELQRELAAAEARRRGGRAGAGPKQADCGFDTNDPPDKFGAKKIRPDHLCNLFAMWSRLVSFAYQVIQLNHGGNCYYDYGSQFLTAVLACDILRRGVNRLSDVLQPYVCPIKIPTDDDASEPPKSAIRYPRKKYRKIYAKKLTSSGRPVKIKTPKQSRRCVSEGPHKSSSSEYGRSRHGRAPQSPRRVQNPMLKLADCFDSLLRDLEHL